MKNEFDDIGNYLIQMGLYLCTVSPKEFEEREEVKDNIINYLMQSYLYLKTYNMNEIKSNSADEEEVKEEYLSRKEVIELYHPLFTEYGLNQSIHTKGLPHLKRGSKYFFKKTEIDKWIEENAKNRSNNLVRYV